MLAVKWEIQATNRTTTLTLKHTKQNRNTQHTPYLPTFYVFMSVCYIWKVITPKKYVTKNINVWIYMSCYFFSSELSHDWHIFFRQKIILSIDLSMYFIFIWMAYCLLFFLMFPFELNRKDIDRKYW